MQLPTDGFQYTNQMHPYYDVARTKPYVDIGNTIRSLPNACHEAPIFEYGPSNGVIRSAFPEEAQFMVRNWPEVDCMRQDYPPNSFSAIIADYTLEHVSHPWKTAQASYDMLVPGGMAIYTTHWMFPDHTGDQEEDYYRYSPKGLRCLFDMFSNVITGYWGDAHLAGKFIEEYSKGNDRMYENLFPEYSSKQIYDAADRLYCVSTWVVAVK